MPIRCFSVGHNCAVVAGGPLFYLEVRDHKSDIRITKPETNAKSQIPTKKHAELLGRQPLLRPRRRPPLSFPSRATQKKSHRNHAGLRKEPRPERVFERSD